MRRGSTTMIDRHGKDIDVFAAEETNERLESRLFGSILKVARWYDFDVLLELSYDYKI
jgi:hypothetical protein